MESDVRYMVDLISFVILNHLFFNHFVYTEYLSVEIGTKLLKLSVKPLFVLILNMTEDWVKIGFW